MMARDNFSSKVRKTIALRAAHFCSNPSCRRLTAGPHSNPNEALTTGHAAHIHVAAAGGPRYDPSQTPLERKSIENAIWLCRECGDIVDKDTSTHAADDLRRWRTDHEAMVAEVRTKGYAESIALLQLRAIEPKVAKRLLNTVEDKRALWELFDAEFPDRVRQSLDRLRREIIELRADLPQGSAMDEVLSALTKTILAFFSKVEKSDLVNLRCNANDSEWCVFRDSLAALRKSVGLQLWNVGRLQNLEFSPELRSIMPELPEN